MSSAVPDLSSLLARNDVEFVNTAYEALLGRTADAGGRDYYVARLRQGYSKLSVLHQLNGSRERASGPKVRGLDRLLSQYARGRLPLVGWIFRKFYKVEGESVNERLLRAILSALVTTPRRGATLPASADRNVGSIDARRNHVAEKLSPKARAIFDRLVSG